jgi:hypothetical protein
MHLAEAIARLYALRVDTTTRDGDGSPHEKPHKPSGYCVHRCGLHSSSKRQDFSATLI